MKSPFSGMDPYIETCGLWEDFHSHLIEAIANALSGQVPDQYVVRTGERAYVAVAQLEGRAEHLFKPDIGVTATDAGKPTSVEGGVALAEAELNADSIPMRAFITTEFRETFVEIYAAAPTRRLVTCIEVLSPSNKRPGTEGWDLYQRKRQGLLLGTANLVELDLLRGGKKMPMMDPWPDWPYTILVARPGRGPLCRVWPASFDRPLRSFPIPLAAPDPDIPLNIQPMIDAIYIRYQYGRDIDYTRPLSPPLSPEDLAGG